MYSREKYLSYAEHCLRLAKETDNPEERLRFMQMAQTWRRLSERYEDIAHLVEEGRDLGILPTKGEMN